MKQSHQESLLELLRKNKETIAALERALRLSSWNEFERIGVGSLLSDVYQGVEQILVLLIEKVHGEKIAKNESWHDNLLKRARELGLYPEEIHRSLRGMLRYRHVQRHGYGVLLDAEKIRANAPEAILAYSAFENHLIK